MFAGFNLDLTERNFSEDYKNIGETHLNCQKANYEKKLEDYILNGTADGSKLQDDWFPQVKADIFISHSHDDMELAQGLAGWLHKTFNLNCFIDANVWGYADKLLEKINEDYSDKEIKPNGAGITYNHQKCNTASKHVNTMLSIALHKMIDKTEAVFVINTPNSIKGYGDIYKTSTYSPWVYSEIICTEIVRKKTLLSYREQYIINKVANESRNFVAELNSQFKAAYEISLEHLKGIDVDVLVKWEKAYASQNGTNALDELYKITHPEEMKKLLNVKIPSVLFG